MTFELRYVRERDCAEAYYTVMPEQQQLRKREFRLLEAIGCGSLTDTEGNVFSAHRCDSSGC